MKYVNNGATCPEGASIATILERMKWNSKPLYTPPPSPQINDEAVQKLKRSIFPSLISGEGRGDNFPIYFVQEV